MTYFTSTREAELSAVETIEAYWNDLCPWWADAEVDPEDRDLIDYSDVADPEVGAVRGYGGDHRVYVPGAYE